jgi:hypothetical protein
LKTLATDTTNSTASVGAGERATALGHPVGQPAMAVPTAIANYANQFRPLLNSHETEATSDLGRPRGSVARAK